MRYTTAKARHEAAVKQYQAAITRGTVEQMVAASDAVEAAHRELLATPDERLTGIQRAAAIYAAGAV